MVKKYMMPLAALSGVLLIYIAAKGLLINGAFTWHLKQPAFLCMIAELLFSFILLSVILIAVKKPMVKLAALTTSIGIFCWIHRIFLPVIVATLYIAYITAAGNILRKKVFKIKTLINFETEFLLGSATLIAMFCLMSAFNFGSIRNIQIFVLVSSLALAAYKFLTIKKQKEKIYRKIEKSFRLSVPEALFVAGIITFFLIQAGRMNIAIDYDSYWYGLRSGYILDNGKGIYENLGSVGLVYTYSKGLEVLTLPFATLPSHSFSIAFNLVLAVIFLHICYKIATLLVSKPYGLMICLLLSSVPGIMNMTITTKTDILTIVFQALLLLYMMYYLEEEKVSYIILSICALLITWALKPTSMVFSTAVFGMSILYLIYTKRLWLKAPIRRWMAVLVSLAALIGIWARTVLLVGVPVTSVFSSTFEKMGFQIKYPFAGSNMKNYSPNLLSKEGMIYIGSKLYGVLLNPSDERMNHVIIAWGTVLIPFALVIMIVGVFLRKKISKRTSDLRRYLYVVFIPIAVISFVSIIMLYRPDGNYFMLFYTMVLLLAGVSVYHIKNPRIRNGFILLLIPFVIFNFVITSLSNWAWKTGFTAPKIFHAGYYDHEKEDHQRMVDLGNEKIWDILSEDPQTRVISIGYHPQVLAFRCNVQSYYDIWVWGDEGLIVTDTEFKKYMEYAKTDYIYVQGGFVNHNSKYTSMLSYLLKDGILTDLIFEEGNVLAKVDLGGVNKEEGYQNYQNFYKNYNFYIDSSNQ